MRSALRQDEAGNRGTEGESPLRTREEEMNERDIKIGKKTGRGR